LYSQQDQPLSPGDAAQPRLARNRAHLLGRVRSGMPRHNSQDRMPDHKACARLGRHGTVRGARAHLQRPAALLGASFVSGPTLLPLVRLAYGGLTMSPNATRTIPRLVRPEFYDWIYPILLRNSVGGPFWAPREDL
jgi:hypothetical protein